MNAYFSGSVGFKRSGERKPDRLVEGRPYPDSGKGRQAKTGADKDLGR